MEKKDIKQHINVDFFENLTGDIELSAPKDAGDIGARIKTLREEKGLSLGELSKLTGFDIDFLSGIENNRVQPQLGTIIKLSKALDSALSRIISGTGDKLYSVTRKNEQKVVSRSTSPKGEKQIYTYKSLAPEVKGRHMEALIVKLEVDTEGEMSVHEGEEFIYILDGTVSLKIGDEFFDLEPGDSVYYLSTTPHCIAAKTGQATILAVLYEG
ncbi:MAG: helix-turn-helix domain-containing protein [Desulfobacterales bacterium]